VRQAFRQYKRKGRTEEPIHVKIRFKNEEELLLMQKSYQKGPIQAVKGEREVDFRIAPEDKVMTVLLGSQPAGEATLNYVKRMALIAKAFPNIRTHLFAFCADHQVGQETLFSRVAEIASQMKDYPENFSIIPFSFQTEHVIAPLFYRSDATCTRSGGQTAMELMCVGTGEIWIHSEAREDQDLLDGIPGWEAASAIYLQKACGAKIVTTETFIPLAEGLYQTNKIQAFSTRPLVSNG
jgi:hypothetical protein